jgi:hypothetical protein
MSHREVKSKDGDCLKEDCAWWDETQAVCSIKNISQQLGYISSDLTQIEEKMPHAGQSTK